MELDSTSVPLESHLQSRHSKYVLADWNFPVIQNRSDANSISLITLPKNKQSSLIELPWAKKLIICIPGHRL